MLKNIIFGLFAALSLLAFYVITMTAFSGLDSAVEQFRALWYLMLPLAGGFGIQVGLFFLIKQTINTKSSLAAGGTSAGVSMLACCAHHLTDVLPVIGLTGLSVFFAKYQTAMLVISIIINALSIAYLLNKYVILKSSKFMHVQNFRRFLF